MSKGREIVTMKAIGFQEIIECNHYLEQNGLSFKIHLRDACGKQTMWIEPLGNCACDGKYQEMYQALVQFFKEKGHELAFSEDQMNFWLAN